MLFGDGVVVRCLFGDGARRLGIFGQFLARRANFAGASAPSFGQFRGQCFRISRRRSLSGSLGGDWLPVRSASATPESGAICSRKDFRSASFLPDTGIEMLRVVTFAVRPSRSMTPAAEEVRGNLMIPAILQSDDPGLRLTSTAAHAEGRNAGQSDLKLHIGLDFLWLRDGY